MANTNTFTLGSSLLLQPAGSPATPVGTTAATVTLSTAQVVAQTPVEIVPVPAAGFYLLPSLLETFFDYGGVAGAGNLELKYDTNQIVSLSGLLDVTADTHTTNYITSLTPENSALKVKTTVNYKVTTYGVTNSSRTTVALDATDTPYVALAETFSQNPTVYTFDGSSWTKVGGISLSGDLANYISIAISPIDNYPYVAYIDGALAQANVYKFDGMNWSLVGAVFGGNASQYTSIAVDSMGTPYVAFIDGSNSNTPTVYTFDGMSWNIVGAAFGGNYSQYTSIAIDSADNLYVAFTDGTNSNTPTVYTFDGMSWNIVGAAFGGIFSSYISIDIDSSDNPYVVFSDGGAGGVPKLFKYTGSWVQVGLAIYSVTGQNISLYLDNSDVPYAVFTVPSESMGKGKLFKFNGLTWEQVIIPFGNGAITSPDISVTSSGTPFVVWSDSTASSKPTAAYYAPPTGSSVTVRVQYQTLPLLP